MPDKADLVPEVLIDFTEMLVPPDPGAVAGFNPSACGGGLQECATLTSAEVAARDEMTTFLTAVTQGFQAYEQVATSCRALYLSGDGRSAAVIGKAVDAVNES
jgi:hypothetical protein